MRTVLLAGAAAFGLTLAAAALGQTAAPPAPGSPAASMAVPSAPDQAPPDQVAPAISTDQAMADRAMLAHSGGGKTSAVRVFVLTYFRGAESGPVRIH